MPAATDDPDRVAEEFARSFPAIYLRFHRRDEKRSELSGASRAVLQHLALIGPVTIGELGEHLDRAQSVTSEIVAHLEAKGLLERREDPEDRRRRLVWLSPAGQRFLARDREVLSVDLLRPTIAAMAPADRVALVNGVAALLEADDAVPDRPLLPTHRIPTRKEAP